VAKLLDCLPENLGDFIRVAALTGMRPEEIGRLTVADCANGVFIVREGMTAAVARRVPIHSDLTALVPRRMNNKAADAFLFDELRSGNSFRRWFVTAAINAKPEAAHIPRGWA